jgi:hypothetical protein
LNKISDQKTTEEETKRKQEDEINSTSHDLKCNFLSLEKRQARRKMTVDEIIDTERSYTESLKTVRDVFVQPIQKNHLISDEQVSAIFSNIVKLIPLHEAFLASLQRRQEKWTAEQLVGDLFQKTVRKIDISN